MFSASYIFKMEAQAKMAARITSDIYYLGHICVAGAYRAMMLELVWFIRHKGSHFGKRIFLREITLSWFRKCPLMHDICKSLSDWNIYCGNSFV